MRALLSSFLLCVTVVAAAQSADTAPAAHAARSPSPATATWLSVGLTIVPAVAGAVLSSNVTTCPTAGYASTCTSSGSDLGSALFLTGLLVGPATGFWYGHIGGKAWPGLAIRTGGLVLLAAGAAGCIQGSDVTLACSGGESAAILGGTILVLGSAIYDMATVGRKVRAHNAAAARAMVVPLFSPSRRSVGAEVVVGF